MKIIEHLKTLDKLIVENCTPPSTMKLRNYLSTIIEPAETEGDLPEAIAVLHRENTALQKANADLKARTRQEENNWKSQLIKRQNEFRKTHTLNYDV